MLKTLPVAAALVLAFGPAEAQDKPELVIYTYESFTSEWGPGPAIKTAFEETCDCTVRFVGAGDGAALLGRLRLEGARSPADIVLGLDTNLTAEADRHRPVRPARGRGARRSTCRSPGTTRSSCPTTGATSPSSTTARGSPTRPPASRS